jgi:hypothetical protein
MSDHDDEQRYILGLIIATQEYLREVDPEAGRGIAAYLRAIAKTERDEGSEDLALRFEDRAESLEEEEYDS